MNQGPQKRPTRKIAAHFENEDAARKHLAEVRWPQRVVCPKCGSSAPVYTLKDGRYRCGDKDCRTSFTVTTGTIFESSHIPLHKWLLAVHLLCSSKKGISSHQLHRTLGITYKSAWFMSHRIREAMREGSLVPLGGKGKIVEVDETYLARIPGRKIRRGMGQKLAIVSLVERGGKARSIYVEDVTAKTIMKIVRENVRHESEVNTDAAGVYDRLDEVVARHDSVSHGTPNNPEYVRYEGDRVISSNTVEGFFSIFKRGMRGVYQHCKEKHLHRYLSEFDFRYGQRFITDSQRADEALRGSIGKRLTYRTSRQEQRA